MTRTVTILALFSVCFSFLLAPLHGEPPKNGIEWETDLVKARKLAIETERPMLIVFGAEWCTFCKKLEATTLAEKEMVAEINKRFVPVHLDFDKQRPVANALKIKAIPCSVVLSTEAEVLSRKDGYARKADFEKLLEDGLKTHNIRLTSGKARVQTE